MAVPIAPEDLVRDVLARFPATAEVFARHGLAGCGAGGGPAERLDVFATAHEIPLETLLEELNAHAQPGFPAERAAAGDEPSRRAEPDVVLYRPFLLVALLSTLTLGATYGAVNLLTIHLGLEAWPYFNHPLHASFQLFGFVLPFILGVAVHAVPRFLGAPLGRPAWARAALPLILLGLVARGAGVFPGDRPGFLLAGALALLAGVGAAAVALFSTRRQPGQRRPFLPWIAAGTAWWAASAAVLAAGAAVAIARGAPEEATYFHEAAYTCALLGGAVGWIVGMLFRLGPAFLYLTPPVGRAGTALFALFQLSVGTAVAGVLLRDVLDLGAGEWVFSFGLLGAGGLLAWYAHRAGIFRRSSSPRPTGDVGLERAMRLAFGFALAFAALVALHLSLELSTGSSRLVLDAARHALGQGFVGLTVLAVASRVVPIFGGVELAWPRLRDPAVLAIAVGVGLRFAEVPAGLGWAPALVVSGISGLIAAGGVGALACALLVTLLRRPKSLTLGARSHPAADMKVAEIIARWPQALEVLVAQGFTPLANPVTRRTLARAVTLEQACRLQGRDLDRVLADLRRAVEAGSK